ncbi:MAG: nucleoside deaminase [Endomicrobium sp.]|nr:nucleoside deaminase [Endomicrobium sp.]
MDTFFLYQAFVEAKKALNINEVPVGAIIVKNNKIISKGFNQCINLIDPTAHAEIIALKKATKKINNYRLNNCYLYVTIEPCLMCIGALINARIKRIVIGSIINKHYKEKYNNVEIIENKNHDLKIKCSSIIKNFFKKKREINKSYIYSGVK